jgi:hypothetical protein
MFVKSKFKPKKCKKRKKKKSQKKVLTPCRDLNPQDQMWHSGLLYALTAELPDVFNVFNAIFSKKSH